MRAKFRILAVCTVVFALGLVIFKSLPDQQPRVEKTLVPPIHARGLPNHTADSPRVVDSTQKSDATQAFHNALKNKEGAARSIAISKALAELAATDPKTALELYPLVPPGAIQEKVLGLMLAACPGEWVASFLKLADEYELPDRRARIVESGLFRNSSVLAKESLFAMYKQSQTESVKSAILGRIIKDQLVAGSPDTALTWLGEQLPEQRQAIESKIFGHFCSLDPGKAADYALANPVYLENPETAFRLVKSAAPASPQKAQQLIAAIPTPEAKAKATYYLMAAWLNYDPKAASAWAGEVAGQQQKDNAAYAVAEYSVRAGDMDAARAWGNTIVDAELKSKAGLIVDGLRPH